MCGVLVVLTTRLWPDSRYGSEKSATFSRSGVIVVPDATASYEYVRRPSKIPLKSSSSYFVSCQRSPTCPQTARMSSASKPVATPSFSTSKGGSGKADATSRVPASIVCNAAIVRRSRPILAFCGGETVPGGPSGRRSGPGDSTERGGGRPWVQLPMAATSADRDLDRGGVIA